MKSIAIIGMSYRLPGTTTNELWSDLLEGKDLITQISADRWSHESHLHPKKNHPGTSYTFSAGSIGDVSGFDAGFFGISPREAALMDPQQRLLLEMSWEAMEHAGVKPSSLQGSQCGVFVGIASADYSYRLADDMAAIDSSVATGNTASIAANRISYVFDLHGPSMAIDTACSSSLVAFHQACRSILSGETTVALAGGVSLHLHPYGFIIFSKASMLSPTGRCNVFDASGDGYVRSEGGGMFLLKDYDLAVADGDNILAVVANTAINMDGRKSGLTVPNPKAQAALLTQAYEQAGIDPADIDYIEAHGTGTAIGDPIETRAIGDALGSRRPKDRPLPIGSVKSNVGHLETASGVAGMVKAIHALNHRVVPATIGIRELNPKIDFEGWKLDVVQQNLPLKKEGKLIIGVNSFGFGGANAHVILTSHEPATAAAQETTPSAPLPVVVTGKDAGALKENARAFAYLLNKQDQGGLYDLAWNMTHRRESLPHRAVVYASSGETAASALLDFANDTDHAVAQAAHGIMIDQATGPVFVYSGNGSQWEGMGKHLLQNPVFLQTIRTIDKLFWELADFSLERELAGENGTARYEFTEIAQPALFALQAGVTEMLRSRGIHPVAVTGHSVGEIAAAWASGCLSIEDAVKVIYHRSRLQGLTKGNGQMTAVGTGAETGQQLIDQLELADAVCIAGFNSHRGLTVAGSDAGLTTLEQALRQQKIVFKRLPLDYAFHSPAMDSVADQIRSSLSDIRPVTGMIPFISTVTGEQLDGTQLDAEYWWDNIRQPVRFQQATEQLLAQHGNVMVEVGPHAVLRNYIADCLKEKKIEGRVIITGTRGKDHPSEIDKAASEVIVSGIAPDLRDLFPHPAKHVEMPSYAWQREHLWHPVTSESGGLLERQKTHALLGYKLKQHHLTWENQIDTMLLPMLADHVVGDSVVFPGTGYAEIALAAATAWLPGAYAEIEELEIRSPLILSDEQTKLTRLHIDDADGTFRINSRDYAQSTTWTEHAVGRILKEPRDLLLQQEQWTTPARTPDFTGEHHQVLTLAAGLNYGPAFSCIAHGWMEGRNTVLAQFALPDTVTQSLASMYVHPAILDCTFQLIIQLLQERLASQRNVTFIPVKMGRLIYRHTGSAPAYARATITNTSTHSLTGEFTVFDTNGVAIITVREARFRSIRLNKDVADLLSFLDYKATPVPHPFAEHNSAFLPLQAVRTAATELATRSVVSTTSRRYAEEIEPLLDSLCSTFLGEALHQLADGTDTLSLSRLHAWQQDNPSHRAWLDYLIQSAEKDQLLVRDGDTLVLAPAQDDITAADIWNSLVADYPDYFQIIQTAGRVGMHLASLISGTRQLDDILPQNTSLASLVRQALGSKTQQRIGNLLQGLIQTAQHNLPAGERLGMLEISEDGPAFAIAAGLSMDFNQCDYTFASGNATSLDEAGRLQDRFPAIRTAAISDEDTTAAPQYQLAVVTLNFSSIEATVQALDYAHARLVSGGTLLVLGQHPSSWIDFVFGAQSAWQETDGSTLCQRDAMFWQSKLASSGLVNSELFELSPNALAGTYLLLAQKDHTQATHSSTDQATPRSWILLAAQSGNDAAFAENLARRLLEHGDMVVHAPAGTADEMATLLRETTQRYGALDGIIHLSGLGASASVSDAEQLLALQVSRCATAAHVIQACEATATETTLWLVTHDAAQHMVADEDGARLSPDAALWGYGRTLLNEASNYAVRLVDIDTTMPAAEMVDSLCRELSAADSEQEVILAAGGARFAPRLRAEARPSAGTGTAADAEMNMHLGFQFPGQLRNLRWEATPRKALPDNGIEVAVHATGLNFRDVMYALGLLSDEAIENGFAGPTLGLEFAGTVTRVNAAESGYKVGDKVVGFGPSSFANRVITQTSAVSHIPAGISFEAAATIPSTFFTVYYALHHLAQVQPGEKVLIHGAAGGVGIAAIQLCKWLGAEIYATAGSDEKRDFLRLMGVDHIHDSRSLAFADEILLQTGGKGVDVVLNSLAGEAINRNFRVLKPFGRFLELGKRDFYENTKIGLRPFRNNLSYFGIDADQLMNARPELTRTLFAEVMDLFEKGILHPLPYALFDAENIVDAFRHMQQARQIGKIVVTYDHGLSHVHQVPAGKPVKLSLPADATYLVTGGLKGFGLRTAQWLAEKGAQHLILVSRSGPSSEESQQAIKLLQDKGVQVHAASCDITDRQAMSALLAETSKTMPPLKGIVHAATVIDDGLIRHASAEQIRNVLGPKMLGAMNLHELTSTSVLDFFVMFSSATTLFGNPGQGNYVAGNLFIENLASYRLSQGLAATCVRWGAIDDVGFLARNEKIKDALQNRMGGSALPSSVALDVLEDMLVAGKSGLGVMETDWKMMSRFLPSMDTPKFSEVTAGQQDNAEHDDGADLARMLDELSDEELSARLIDMLRVEIGEILRVAPEKIDPARSIYDMGLDSLMGVELVVALESRFGIRLPVMALSENPTTIKLSEFIISKLRGAVEEEQSDDTLNAQVLQISKQHGSDTSAETIAALARDVQSSATEQQTRIIH